MKRKGKIDCTSDYRDQKRGGGRKEMAAKLRALVEREKRWGRYGKDRIPGYCKMEGEWEWKWGGDRVKCKERLGVNC